MREDTYDILSKFMVSTAIKVEDVKELGRRGINGSMLIEMLMEMEHVIRKYADMDKEEER